MENQIASTSKLTNPIRATTSKKKDLNEAKPFISRAGQSTTEFVNEFWQHTITVAENSKEDFKHQVLPLARIKKVMRSDPKVKMISSEVTILFEKACQIFIQELTARSHLNSLSSRRRTLSRPDIAQAIAKSDMFDFLIDIVPREEGFINIPSESGVAGVAMVGKNGKKNGRGKGKKNKEKEREKNNKRESSDFDDSFEQGVEGDRSVVRESKRIRNDDYVSGIMSEGLLHPEFEGGEFDEGEEEELMLEIGEGSNTSNTLSPYANVEVIDWTANDFKIN